MKDENWRSRAVELEGDKRKLLEKIAALEKEKAEAVLAEMERCAKIVDEWATRYPVDIFGDPPKGFHGATTDACSAKALRTILPNVAAAIREGRD